MTALLKSSHTTYVGAIGEDYHIAVMLVARDLREVTDFVDSLSTSTRGAAFETSISTCLSVTIFQPKYLGVRDTGPASLSYGVTERVHSLDTLDHKILRALGSPLSTSTMQLAKALGAPASTITYRMQSLREKGVLIGLGLSVLPFNDGYFAFAFQVCAGSMPKVVRKKFVEFCSNHPSVSYLI